MKIVIIGCGEYGTALLCMFRENGCQVKMWDKYDTNFCKLRKDNPHTIFTTDLKRALNDTDLIVIAIPIPYLEETVKLMVDLYEEQDILIASKGINTKTGMFANEIIDKYLNVKRMGAIAGGTFAIDMKNKKVMGLTLGTKSASLKKKVQRSLENKYLKIQYTDDMIGILVCGAIKNVMAIGCGLLDGAGYPVSTRFFFLTKALYEVDSFIRYLDGSNNTIITYAGIGDMMMTCTSPKSRNFTFGNMIGTEVPIKQISNFLKENTVEGYDSALGIHIFCQRKKIKLEICEIIYDILYKHKKIDDLIKYLEK